MSAVKRSRQRPDAAPQRSSSQPSSKRIKSSHGPSLDFLVNEDTRAGRTLDARLTNGVPRSTVTGVDESHANLASDTSGRPRHQAEQRQPKKQKPEPEIIAISSGEEESSELEEDDDDAESTAPPPPESEPQRLPLTNGQASAADDEAEVSAEEGAEDAEMEDRGDDADETTEPTFGDLLQARHPEPIHVQQSLQATEGHSQELVPTAVGPAIPSGHSLGTLLRQALKSKDKDLLETCFRTTDTSDIRATVQRQTSREAAELLEEIALRIHKRPGRTGNLMIWVQWALVCHGGYLAHQPELMSKLRSLSQVVRERANGLQPLLHLKGKLDLLTAQLELRRGLQHQSRAVDLDEEDEQAVHYVEGRDEDWSDSDGVKAEKPVSQLRGKKAGKTQQQVYDESDGEDMDLGAPNGVSHGEDDESSIDGDEEQEGLLDIEAQESEEEADSDNEAASDTSSAAEEEESSEEESDAVKQPQPSKLNRKR